MGLAQNECRMKKQHVMKREIKTFIKKAKPTVLPNNALCVDSGVIVGECGGRPRGGTFLSPKPSTVETDTRGQVGMVELGAC